MFKKIWDAIRGYKTRVIYALSGVVSFLALMDVSMINNLAATLGLGPRWIAGFAFAVALATMVNKEIDAWRDKSK